MMRKRGIGVDFFSRFGDRVLGELDGLDDRFGYQAFGEMGELRG